MIGPLARDPTNRIHPLGTLRTHPIIRLSSCRRVNGSRDLRDGVRESMRSIRFEYPERIMVRWPFSRVSSRGIYVFELIA